MLIDGEKYACEACVRGHRVSSCQHADRPLQHINKKGRPVSQCPHCRGLRKSRATHAACECGSKPHKQDEHKPVLGTKPEPADKQCCCTHGMKCTCALKKEPLDTVPEMNPPAIPGNLRRTPSNKKPRLAKAGSDNSVATFANPSTRPISRTMDSAPQLGTAFKIPIPHGESGTRTRPRRSTDSLPMLKRKKPSFDSPQIDTITSVPGTKSSKSEQGSPGPRNLDHLGHLDFDFGGLDGMPQFDFSSTFYTPHDETPAHSAFELSSPTEWPAFDAPLEEYTSYGQHTNPYMGTGQQSMGSSSGEISDFSDYLSPVTSRPQLSTANSDENALRQRSPGLYPSMSAMSSEENLAVGYPHSTIRNIVQNRPQYLSSDESIASRLSSSVHGMARPRSQYLSSEESLVPPSSLQNIAQNRPQNLSSDESLANHVSPSYHNLPQPMSPVERPFKPPAVTEAIEESYLPQTLSPKKTNLEQFATANFAHSTSNANTSAIRPPTSSPKQPHGKIDQIEPPNYNAPQPLLQDDPRPHPTEVTPTEFSQVNPVPNPPIFQSHAQQPVYQPSPLHQQQPVNEQSPPRPQQPQPPSLNQQQPPHQQQQQRPQPTELTPTEFGQASPDNPINALFPRPSPAPAPARSDAQRMPPPQSSSESVEQLKSPAVGGAPEDFTKQGLSLRDAQRLAHPQSLDNLGSLTGAGGLQTHALSVQDAQRLAHPDQPENESGGARMDTRSDAFKHPGLSVQAAQRLAHPLTPTEAMSGLTIPQTPQSGSEQEEKNVWAGGRSTSPGSDSVTSYVSQQEVEGPPTWRAG